MKLRTRILIILAVIVCAFIALAATILFTPVGSKLVIDQLMDRWGKYADVSIGEIDGNLVQGLRLSNVKMLNGEKFPPGSTLDITSVSINLVSLRLDGFNLAIENARLKLPVSNSILFFGSLNQGVLDFSVYSHNVETSEVLKLFPENKTLKHVEGFLTKVDLKITGTYQQPLVSGNFHVDKVVYKFFSLSEAPGKLNLSLTREDGKFQLRGPVSFKEGEVLAKNIKARLEQSRVVFTGSPKVPDLFLKGHSFVNEVKINIRITGPRSKPKMELTSVPALPETKLLLMLVTGKGWAGLDESVNQGTISPGLASDVLDYFIFGGSGSGIAKRLGIKDVSVIYDEGKRGIAIREGLTEQIELGYGIEEAQDDTQNQSVVTQTLEGEIKMTEKVSVVAERELKKNYDPTTSTQVPISSEADDKLMLKYKHKF